MRKGTAIGYCSFCFCLVVGCFTSKVTSMLKTGEPSERDCSTFDTTVEILRDLKEPTGITSILANCNVSFRQSGCGLGFMKSSDVTRTNAAMANFEYYPDMLFQYRKKRPQERGRKKRRKGKWDPIDRLWNSPN